MDLAEYKEDVAIALGESEGDAFDAGVVLLVAVMGRVSVDRVVEFTGLSRDFVHRILWRADIYGLLNGVRWHENDIIFICDILVALGRIDRRQIDDGDFEYLSYPKRNYRNAPDGRTVAAAECHAICNKYEVSLKEARELRRERSVDIDEVTIDATRVDPFESPVPIVAGLGWVK